MKISKKETLLLSREEISTLTKARNLLHEIFAAADEDGRIEAFASYAYNNIYDLLKESEEDKNA